MNDIKTITKQLSSKPKINGSNHDVENKINGSKKSNSDDFFDSLKNIVDQKKYENKSVVYLDENIHEVFSLIKLKKKISIGQLISYILEDFITENNDKISKLNSNNKYL